MLWQGPNLISAFLFLVVALSHVLPLDFFACTLLVSALSRELMYRNSDTTYAASGTGGGGGG